MKEFYIKRFDLGLIKRSIKVFTKSKLALQSTVGDLADLDRVVVFPALAIHFLEEGHNIDWINEVDESIADVALIDLVQW